MIEHHERAAAPSTAKALLIGIAPALLVVVLIIVGALLYTAPPPANPDQDEITAVMQRYLDGMNAGDSALFKSALCESSNAITADLADGAPLESGRGKLVSVSGVQVSGDTATALVTAAVEDAPELGPKSTQLNFVNEDGWKLC